MNLWDAIPTFTATAVWFIFIVWYQIRSKWWRNPYGRHLMAVSTLLFLVTARISLLHIFGTHIAFTQAGFLLYSLIAIVGIEQIIMMERDQRDKK